VRAGVATAASLALLLLGSARAAETDWGEVQAQAVAFLSAYVRVDTTNPPGNEAAAARFLADRFGEAGIEAEVFESDPGRGSVLARLPASAPGEHGRPVVLLNHLDVVPAVAEEWEVPPFAGAVQDGYVYGRGALDCKGVATVEAMAMMQMKRQKTALRRDVIFLGTADEEAGGKLGAGWFVAHHFDKLRDAEFVLNEGGSIRVLANGRRAYEVAVSEKTPCWLRLTASGEGGHGSAPPAATSVTRLLRALEHLQSYQPELQVVPEVQAYYAALAALQEGEKRTRYADLRAALADPVFRAEFLEDPHDAALVRNTLTPTVLRASQKVNIIPQTASAELDCRLLPGQDPKAFVSAVRKAIADPDLEVDVLLNFPPSSSPTDTALYRALGTLAQREGASIVPQVLRGFTDSHYFREKGIASYGFVPVELSREEESREHGADERLSATNLRDGTRRLVELLQMIGG
jgi:acetylornithine deacetylase/succinyl-diaminopimelate desuccinylase-like protein